MISERFNSRNESKVSFAEQAFSQENRNKIIFQDDICNKDLEEE